MDKNATLSGSGDVTQLWQRLSRTDTWAADQTEHMG